MDNTLSSKKCVPCQGGIPALSEEQTKQYLQNLPNWTSNDYKSIRRDFKFKNFRSALDFTNKVGQIAEEENHHPDIELGWGYCNITLQTHSIGGLHENDFIIAAKIDEITT